jgi:dienelactone hydrolase
MPGPTPFTEDAGIPIAGPTPITSYSPVTLKIAGRHVDLKLKVTAPVTGTNLPIILFSHGGGPANFVTSFHGYAPVCEFWAARGFVVIRPTHQDANILGLREMDDPDAPTYARSRVQDMSAIIGGLDDIEATVPGLAGRLDHSRIAAVGHSMGGQTVALLCGAGMSDPVSGEQVTLRDERIKVGVLMSPPGLGRDLGPMKARLPVLASTTFDNMITPALVVVGENDHNAAFSDRDDWRSDAYQFSPAPKSRILYTGADHFLGGIGTWDGEGISDESPERVAAVGALVWAYLRSSLRPEDPAWTNATIAIPSLAGSPNPLALFESK